MTAIEEAEAAFRALGEAEWLAWQAMCSGRIRYTDRLGFSEQNLLALWSFYCRMTRASGPQLERARRQLRRAIKVYRRQKAAITHVADSSARRAA